MLRQSTYRSLGEQQLSPAEERFEKGRRTIGLFLAPLVALVFLALPNRTASGTQRSSSSSTRH